MTLTLQRFEVVSAALPFTRVTMKWLDPYGY